MKLRTIYVDTVDVMYNLIWCFILLWSCYLLFQGVGSYICGVNWRQLVMSGCILSLLWIWGCVHNVCALLTFIFWQSHNVLYHIISCFHNVFLAASIVRWWKGAYNWAQGFLSSHTVDSACLVLLDLAHISELFSGLWSHVFVKKWPEALGWSYLLILWFEYRLVS